MTKLFSKLIMSLKSLTPWRVWTCQKHQDSYLIMEVDMRRPHNQNTVFKLKTNKQEDFINILKKISKCSTKTAYKIYAELQNPNVNCCVLENNKKIFSRIMQDNLRPDLRNQPLFTF